MSLDLSHLCQTCGACCATDAAWPRFSLEDEADLALIPPDLVKPDGSGMACEGDRCKALAGEIGRATTCTIYGLRPDVCRLCQPGDDACAIARTRHGLTPLA
ncbi:hypothetical protein A8950_2173 [Dongia mobilis]|uniref:Uncharacterized protein n=1 Tax=Dongia mobilis TaxID=578943 RepID=A0A4R6WTX9_9PROT|nr:YkgJ family cysteine cluster protein [Dongia mobilis]TDQ82350.1 hypothetical protein A8950_2173 [Dongia mobilis]